MPPNTFINNRHLNILYLSIIVLAYVVGFYQSIEKLVSAWSSGDDSYCFLVIPIVIYLCWEKREHFKFYDFSWSLLGIPVLLLSISFILIGDLGAVKTLQHIGHWMFFVGLATTAYGRRVGMLLFPLIILFFIVPLPPYVNRLLTFNLQLISSHVATEMFRLFNISVFQNGNIIDLGVHQLQVVEACSGLRYLMPMILMSLLIGHFIIRGVWRKAALFSSVLPLLLLTNASRVFVTGILITSGYTSIAEGLSHDAIGLFVFLFSGALLFGLAIMLKNVRRNPAVPTIEDPGTKHLRLQTSLVLVISISLILVVSSWALKQIPSLLIHPQREIFESFPMNIGDWNGNRLSLPNKVLDSLWADDYVRINYRKISTENTVFLLISFYNYQVTKHTAHAPQTCILGSGWTLQSQDDKTVGVTPDKNIPIKLMLLEKADNQILGAYFFFQRGRIITNPWLNKFYIFWDAVTMRRTDGALVRVEMNVPPGQSLDSAYAVLEGFIIDLWPLLHSFLPS